jgi:hypothetical protein
MIPVSNVYDFQRMVNGKRTYEKSTKQQYLYNNVII